MDYKLKVDGEPPLIFNFQIFKVVIQNCAGVI